MSARGQLPTLAGYRRILPTTIHHMQANKYMVDTDTKIMCMNIVCMKIIGTLPLLVGTLLLQLLRTLLLATWPLMMASGGYHTGTTSRWNSDKHTGTAF